MTDEEHILQCLSEECAEVTKNVSKALRFGLDDTKPDRTLEGDFVRGDGPTNRQKIVEEFHDALAVYAMLEERGVFEGIKIAPDWCERKKQKVLLHMEYARSRGTLPPK